MTDENKDKILGRIKKMMALSKSSNANEAQTALAMAQKLMEKHGVTELDVVESQIGEIQIKSRTSVSKVKVYEARLYHTLKKAFGVGLVWRPGSSYATDPYGRWVLIGPNDQLEVAAYVAEVLGRKLAYARAEFLKRNPHLVGRRATIEADTFCDAWVVAVGRTIHEFAQPEEMRAAIDRMIADRTGGEKAKQRDNGRGSFASQVQGLEAGSKESLYRPMNDKAEKTNRLEKL